MLSALQSLCGGGEITQHILQYAFLFDAFHIECREKNAKENIES